MTVTTPPNRMYLREGLDPNKNLWEAVSGGLDFIEVAGVEVPTRAYARPWP